MNLLDTIADRFHGARRRDETTKEAVQRGLHRQGFKHGYAVGALTGVLVTAAVFSLGGGGW